MLNTRIGYLALFSALFISSIAIFFSVAGLAAIYSAYAISIIVMGTAIELGKLAAVVWLHHNWHDRSTLLKGAISFLVVCVMFVTSMGIFGYLSKSHVEQTALSQESVAQVQRIDTEIARYNSIILRSEQKIQGFEDNGSGVDASLNGQIDREQARIDTAYDRVKPVIQVQLDIISTDETKTENRTKPYQSELTAITQQLADLQTALSNKEIKTAQGIVGTRPDGSYKTKTVAAIAEFRTRNEARRNVLLEKIDKIRGTPSPAAANAQLEINRIRASVQNEIDESNATIKNLRSRMGKASDNDIETLLSAQRDKIKEANAELDTLTEEKYKLQATYRKLEAEVGPLKYIAEFVSNKEADARLLEKAVQWLTILIIIIFDPFAILLLIAAQHSFDKGRKARLAENPTVEDLLDDFDPTLTEEDKEWLNAKPVGHEFGSEEEPEMPENETVPEHEVNYNHEWDKIPTFSDYFDDEELFADIKEESRAGQLSIIRVDKNYINFNGQVYQEDALSQAHPDLNLDFYRQVRSGTGVPSESARGDMFLQFDSDMAHLLIFNGAVWNKIDKNVLHYSAYTHEYIKRLIKKIGTEEYDPMLLNEAEQKHIEDLLHNEKE